MTARHDPPKHYLGDNGYIACGVRIHFTKRGGYPPYTRIPDDVSCFKCALHASGLTNEQRRDIRDNARFRLGRT